MFLIIETSVETQSIMISSYIFFQELITARRAWNCLFNKSWKFYICSL